MLTVLLDQARQTQLTDQLRKALTSRSVIDQAVGILMAQERCTSAEAFALLRRASQRANRKLHAVASEMVGSTGGEPPRSSPFIEG